jgi:hypothetical protein
VVLGGRAHDYDAGLAYASLKDVVASMPLDQLDPPTAAARDAFVVAADGAVRRGPRSDVVQSSGRLRGTFALCPHGETLLRLEAARDPTVVALDDASLADDESLTALAFTARHVASVPLGRSPRSVGPGFQVGGDHRALGRTPGDHQPRSARPTPHHGDPDLLAELTDVDPVGLQAAFDSLSRASVLVRSATGWYRFCPPLAGRSPLQGPRASGATARARPDRRTARRHPPREQSGRRLPRRAHCRRGCRRWRDVRVVTAGIEDRFAGVDALTCWYDRVGVAGCRGRIAARRACGS